MKEENKRMLKEICVMIGVTIILLGIFWYRTTPIHFARSYWNVIETTSPEDRDVEEVMNMIYFKVENDPVFNALRKEYYQKIEVSNYEFLNIKRIEKDLYEFDMLRDIIVNDRIFEEAETFYVVKVEDKWRIVFGQHNIPDKYIEIHPELSNSPDDMILSLPGDYIA